MWWCMNRHLIWILIWKTWKNLIVGPSIMMYLVVLRHHSICLWYMFFNIPLTMWKTMFWNNNQGQQWTWKTISYPRCDGFFKVSFTHKANLHVNKHFLFILLSWKAFIVSPRSLDPPKPRSNQFLMWIFGTYNRFFQDHHNVQCSTLGAHESGRVGYGLELWDSWRTSLTLTCLHNHFQFERPRYVCKIVLYHW